MFYTQDQVERAIGISTSRYDALYRLAQGAGEVTPCPISAGEKQEGKPPMYAEKRMYNDALAIAQIKAPESDLSKARERLESRLRKISDQKDQDLRKQFSMDLTLPKTRKELFDGIAAGTFKLELPAEKDDRPVYDYEPLRSIRIANPAKDEAGYLKASEARREARESALDIILTQDEKAGLDALNAFKAWTFSA